MAIEKVKIYSTLISAVNVSRTANIINFKKTHKYVSDEIFSVLRRRSSNYFTYQKNLVGEY